MYFLSLNMNLKEFFVRRTYSGHHLEKYIKNLVFYSYFLN